MVDLEKLHRTTSEIEQSQYAADKTWIDSVISYLPPLRESENDYYRTIHKDFSAVLLGVYELCADWRGVSQTLHYRVLATQDQEVIFMNQLRTQIQANLAWLLHQCLQHFSEIWYELPPSKFDPTTTIKRISPKSKEWAELPEMATTGKTTIYYAPHALLLDYDSRWIAFSGQGVGYRHDIGRDAQVHTLEKAKDLQKRLSSLFDWAALEIFLQDKSHFVVKSCRDYVKEVLRTGGKGNA